MSLYPYALGNNILCTMDIRQRLKTIQKTAGIFCVFCIIFLFVHIYAQNLAKRSSYDVPLIRLNILDDKENPGYKKVRVAIRESDEYALFTIYNDQHIKISRQEKERITYAEPLASASALTDFEAEQLDRVINSFIATLEILERDLEKERWDRCLYLDSYLPRFLNGFYYLTTAVFNSRVALPDKAHISDSWYDVSLNSLKSDQRLQQWLGKKDYVIKLRIAAKELVYQIKDWQKKELNAKKRAQLSFSENLQDAYCLFVQLYFNVYNN